MPLSPSTLEDWINYDTGPIDSAEVTQKRIRKALERKSSPLVKDNRISFDTGLQGSYANHTIVHTHGEVSRSDVDILVELESTYHAGLSALPNSHQQNWWDQRAQPNIEWQEFRRLVIEQLENVYDSGAVSPGDKCIDVETASLPLPADVIVCEKHKRYTQFFSSPGKFDEGIRFWTQSGNEIVNYPEQHKDNGTDKQGNTNNRFKPTVRMFKRARNQLVRDAVVQKKNVPSYFIECLLYRVPDEVYVHNLQERYCYIVNYLARANLGNLKCQNEIVDMFGSDETQWTVLKANRFVNALIDLWQRS